MKKRFACFVLPLVAFWGFTWLCAGATDNQGKGKEGEELYRDKLIALLDEVLADQEVIREMKKYDIDLAKLRDVSNLVYHGEGHWSLSPWSIQKKSENQYTMRAIGRIYRNGERRVIFIDLEGGDKYILQKWDIVHQW